MNIGKFIRIVASRMLVLPNYRLGIVALGLAALAAAADCGKSNGRTAPKLAAVKSGVPVEVEILKTQRIDHRISATGSLMANEEVELRAEVSGRITGVFFQEGQPVHKGNLLLKINDQQLKAQLKRNEAAERQASDEEARERKLFELKSISQEEYDRSLNALHMAEADREATHAQLAQTEIRAPFDGLVGLRHVSEGGYVTPDVLAATMQDIDPMKVEFAIPEKYASLIKNGTPIVVRVENSPAEIPGSVYAVESKLDAGTRTITARARIPNPDGKLIPGSFARVEIALAQLDQEIVVPSSAVVPDIAGELVYLCQNGKAKAVRVKTGIRTETGVQIVDGLAANDTLVTTGLMQMADGKPLQIIQPQSR